LQSASIQNTVKKAYLYVKMECNICTVVSPKKTILTKNTFDMTQNCLSKSSAPILINPISSASVMHRPAVPN
jgi:hypothetical protein